MKRALFIIEARAPVRVEEALRAALGATLRGGAVEVWLPADGERTALAARAIGVLETFGHAVREAGAREPIGADAVEVWTDLEARAPAPRPGAAGASPTLHLLREGSEQVGSVDDWAAGDWIVALSDPPHLLPHGSPPLPAGPLSFDELHRLLALAARVVTW